MGPKWLLEAIRGRTALDLRTESRRTALYLRTKWKRNAFYQIDYNSHQVLERRLQASSGFGKTTNPLSIAALELRFRYQVIGNAVENGLGEGRG